MADAVFHPSHYSTGRFTIECIAITRHMSCCASNAFKYTFRHREKNGLEDLRKAAVYLRWAIEDAHPAVLPGREQHVRELVAEHILPYSIGHYEALIDIASSNYAEALNRVESAIRDYERGAA
ncbi:DUF3310 domain-containing protein [Nocardia sp. NPDC057455]|uniref:DUF3310 domain-containing protein n=1 Tax=Nocardia sp. NPDC057455 TaxID=3346138 RepID=UPI00366BB901